MAAKIVAQRVFSAFGKDYEVGDEVDVSSWNQETIDRRVENGWVALSAEEPKSKGKGKKDADTDS